MAYPGDTIDYGDPVVKKSIQTVTIVGGVATVSYFTPVVKLAAESSTSDTLDTLTVVDVQEGDIIHLVADAGDTITVDDASIDLLAATVALTADSTLSLRYNGTQWSQMYTVVSPDNA